MCHTEGQTRSWEGEDMKEGKSRDREERKGMGEGRGKREMGQE